MVINTNIEKAASLPTESMALAGQELAWESLYASYAIDKHHVAYVWGAPGTGKTHLVQNFSDYLQENSHSVLWSSVRYVGLSKQDWERHLSRFAEGHGDLSGEMLIQAMISRCQRQPFCWIVDAFDSLGSYRESIIQLAMELRRHGGYVILTGRTSPFRLWSAQSYIRSHIHVIELTNWEPEFARTILANRGVTDATIVETAIRLSQGRPQLLTAIADGLSVLQDSTVPAETLSFMTNPVDLSGYLIEQICHPGSQRMTWRAGQSSDSVDTLIAAAALVPMFNREWMTRVVGRTVVNHFWDEFVTLPFLESYRGGYYRLFVHLRPQIAAVVQKNRPWTWEQWTKKAAGYYLSRLQSGTTDWQQAWKLLSGFIRPRLGSFMFDTNQPAFSVVWSNATTPVSTRLDLHLTDSEGRIVAESTGVVGDSGALHIIDSAWDLTEPGAMGQMVSALAATFYQYREIVWDLPSQPPDLTAMLEFLQFTRGEDTSWSLQFHDRSFKEWIAQIVAPPAAQSPSDPVGAVQRVLHAIRDNHEDYGADVEQFWHRTAAWGSFRTWFLDALHSAPLGEHVDGKTVLVLYYLDHRGTHEELAEVLHVSRATYFRNHRGALEKLAEAVFG